MSLQWPEPMTDGGRLSQSERAEQTGRCLVVDPKMSCPQALNITLFFDGTNNNDDPNTPHPDSLGKTHTNVARLRNVALTDPENGIFRLYAQGVGTPFPDIGEEIYSQDGKALAKAIREPSGRCLRASLAQCGHHVRCLTDAGIAVQRWPCAHCHSSRSLNRA